MSLFIKIERFASQPRLLHLREFKSTVGENYQGCIDTTQIKVPFFSVVSHRQTWWLITQNSSTIFNHSRLARGACLEIQHGAALECRDTRFTFFPISPLNEVLAYSDLSLAELVKKRPLLDNIPSLHVTLAGVSRSFPLVPGIKLLAGSAPDCALCIGSTLIAPHHCAFVNCGTQISVEPLQGQFTVEAGQSHERTILDLPSCVILQPVGLPVHIIPWGNDKKP